MGVMNRPDGGPQPRHAIERDGDAWTAIGSQVVSGAFRIASRTDDLLVLERRPEYEGPRPGNASRLEFVRSDVADAIEPYARRLWPQFLVSWVRVLEGRFRDPLVGRDLMIGCAAGAIGTLLRDLQVWIPASLGGAVALPSATLWTMEPLRGAVPAFVSILGIHTQELTDMIFPLTLLLILRLLLRRTLPAFIVVSLVGTVLFFPDSGSVTAFLVAWSISVVLYGLVLFRCGLLGLAAMLNVTTLTAELPLTPHPSGWYAGATLLSLAFIVAPALYGFWISQSGRPLFRDEVLEPAARR
jgi:serine/threonine-protein kinase